eukprot:TRINITY_DN10221_c0_g1_i4.p1 TRINITY_DN10221_c0_g1~~TRINITY_DN10221_c0_g1_i4.p1  ORF type:complete len:549 (-),score=100.39 TRINITY_DN10221_c0_g1_i4:1124-2707(-)
MADAPTEMTAPQATDAGPSPAVPDVTAEEAAAAAPSTSAAAPDAAPSTAVTEPTADEAAAAVPSVSAEAPCAAPSTAVPEVAAEEAAAAVPSASAPENPEAMPAPSEGAPGGAKLDAGDLDRILGQAADKAEASQASWRQRNSSGGWDTQGASASAPAPSPSERDAAGDSNRDHRSEGAAPENLEAMWAMSAPSEGAPGGAKLDGADLDRLLGQAGEKAEMPSKRQRRGFGGWDSQDASASAPASSSAGDRDHREKSRERSRKRSRDRSKDRRSPRRSPRRSRSRKRSPPRRSRSRRQERRSRSRNRSPRQERRSRSRNRSPRRGDGNRRGDDRRWDGNRRGDRRDDRDGDRGSDRRWNDRRDDRDGDRGSDRRWNDRRDDREGDRGGDRRWNSSREGDQNRPKQDWSNTDKKDWNSTPKKELNSATASRGKLKRYLPDKRFGFIETDDGGDDLFAHGNEFLGDADSLVAGARVLFEKEFDNKKGKYKAAAWNLDPDSAPAAPIAHQPLRTAHQPPCGQRYKTPCSQ